MTWNLTWLLEPVILSPLQSGVLTNIELTNNYKAPIVVYETLLRFDWMGSYRFSTRCNLRVEPGAKSRLPDVYFTVDLVAGRGSHKLLPGVSYHHLENGQWLSHPDTYVQGGSFMEVRPLPKKNFKVFVSHSNVPKDRQFIQSCKESMEACGLTAYFAEADVRPGHKLWDKIHREIVASDAVLVLLTKGGSKSGDVREEIGIAVGLEKRIVPIVEVGVKVGGTLRTRDVEYVNYDGVHPYTALAGGLKMLVEWATSKQLESVTKTKAIDRTRKAVRASKEK